MIARLVLFGTAGDLTSRLLLPAIAQLAEAKLLPPGLSIVGSDLTEWSTDDFRQHIAAKLTENATVTPPAPHPQAPLKSIAFSKGRNPSDRVR